MRGSKQLVQIRDIVRHRISKAARALRGRTPPSDEAVHYARKQLKRARAGLRLLRDAVPAVAYARENAELRDAARPLSLVRDARVMLDTQKRVRSGAANRHDACLRHTLRAERANLRREILERPANRRRIARALARAERRVGHWRLEGDDRRVFRAGMKRIYRRGREALARVHTDRSVENLHEFRKQVKYLGLAMEALKSIRVRHLGKPAKRAELIADALGDGHDLAVLGEKLTSLSPAVQDVPKTLLSRIDRRRTKLEKEAVKRGERLYGVKPKAYVARLF